VTASSIDLRASGAPVRTLFFGSGEFAVPILEALRGSGAVDVVAVVTAPDRPAGRRATLTPTPLARAAHAVGLDVRQPASLREPTAAAELAALGPELAILADYGRIVPPSVLAIPKRGFLNLHPSLLPRHRGATPIPAAIVAGDRETGVSLFEMDEQLDHGPVVAERRVALPPDATAGSLEPALAALAASLLVDALPAWLEGSLTAVPQDESLATLSRPLNRSDGQLDPGLPAAELERRVRAYDPWPGTYLQLDSGRLGIRAAAVRPTAAGDTVGALITLPGGGVALATADGRLELLEVQPAGGRPMPASDWRRGHSVPLRVSLVPRDITDATATAAAGEPLDQRAVGASR